MNRMGSHVCSNRQGISYVRMYKPPRDAKTEARVSVRKSFSRLVETWKGPADIMKESWNRTAGAQRMTGYNAFLATYFEAMAKA